MLQQNTPDYPVSREKLYELAWSQPMTSIAKLFDVSSSYLARVYTRLDVPRPAPGYWAKVAAGKTVIKPELPEAGPDDEVEWDRYNELPSKMKSLPKAPIKSRSLALPKRDRPKIHSLIQGAKVHFLKTRKSDIGYLRPYKRLLVDLIVSKSNLDTALEVANKLFLALEDYGYKVKFAPAQPYFKRPEVDERNRPDKGFRHVNHWYPSRETIVYVGTIAIGITLFEVSERKEAKYINGEYVPLETLKEKRSRYSSNSWITHKDFPSGNFCLQAYSPYRGTTWLHQRQISANSDVTKQGHKIARALKIHVDTVATEILKAEKEAERRRIEWEEQKRQWEVEAAKRRSDEAHKESRQELLGLIDAWAEAKRINAFFDEVEAQALELSHDANRSILERLELARSFIGLPDALQKILNWATPIERMNQKEGLRY
ncbi:MAG: hypothetical protein KDI24_06655 [Pseudomonadales bacterium]|nr:hypothetical protein [Pseudomonadales bacterium]